MGTLLVFLILFLPFCQTWQHLVEIVINEQNLAFYAISIYHSMECMASSH